MFRVPAPLLAAALSGCLAPSALCQTVVQGPLAAPAGPSRYYVVQAPTWSQARAKALAMGGDLCTIETLSENQWITAHLTDNATRKLFIGYNDAQTEGTFRWSSGSPSTFTNWRDGEPHNSADSDYVMLQPGDAGRWDCRTDGYTTYAVVEISGPLRVPQEFPTIAQAVAAMDAARTREIELAPGGTYPMSSVASPTSDPWTLRGNGSVIVCPQINAAFSTSGDATLYDVEFQAESSACLLIGPGTVRAFNVNFVAQPGNTAAAVYITPVATFLQDGGRYTAFAAAFQLLFVGGSGRADVRNVVMTGLRQVAREQGLNISISNSTITGCGPQTLFDSRLQVAVRSSIVWGNPGIVPTNVAMSYSNHDTLRAGPGNISADPLFTDAAAGDFRLRPGSPSIDRGSIRGLFQWVPAVGQGPLFRDADGFSRVADDLSVPNLGDDAVAVDQGAYEFQGTSCPGDFNHDGVVDFFDYLDFVGAFAQGC